MFAKRLIKTSSTGSPHGYLLCSNFHTLYTGDWSVSHFVSLSINGEGPKKYDRKWFLQVRFAERNPTFLLLKIKITISASRCIGRAQWEPAPFFPRLTNLLFADKIHKAFVLVFFQSVFSCKKSCRTAPVYQGFPRASAGGAGGGGGLKIHLKSQKRSVW